MVTEILNAQQVRQRIVAALGLDTRIEDLEKLEVLAGLVRRAASLIAPCPPRALMERVLTGLQDLVDTDEAFKEEVEAVVDAVTSYGDLIELPAPDDDSLRSYLYAAPPSFVETASGTLFIVGVAPDGNSLLPGALAARVRYRGHTRSIQYSASEDLPSVLSKLGLHSLAEKLWFRQPRVETAAERKARYDAKLALTKSEGSFDELLILDTSKPVTYYRGRWGSPRHLSGHFIGRREQRYGAPLWSYVALADGTPTNVLDLPTGEGRGCDEAWHLQMALDALAGRPQEFRAELTEADTVLVRLFSPLPAWWQRRWDVLGTPVAASRCLCAYELVYEQYVADLPRLRNELWMSEQ